MLEHPERPPSKKPAGLGKRLVAYVIDFLLVSSGTLYLNKWIATQAVSFDISNTIEWFTLALLLLILLWAAIEITPKRPFHELVNYIAIVMGRLLGFVAGVLCAMLSVVLSLKSYNPTAQQANFVGLVVFLGFWLYWGILESSPLQATLGKKLMGIIVSDIDGKRISFFRATARSFGRFIILAFWPLFVLFYFLSGKEVGWIHDLMALTLVVEK